MAAQQYHRSDNAEVYRTNASFVYSNAFTAAVVKLLDPRPGDHVIDLGCGSGELTLEVASAVGPDGSVLGLDASADMIVKAQSLAARSTTSSAAPIEFVVKDGHDALHDKTVDKVFSNAALHWMKRSPSAVVKNVYGVLRPGGRFAAEMGGHMNCVGVRGQLHRSLRQRGLDPTQYDPWFFPTPQEYRQLLLNAGFQVESCELVPRITPLPKESGLRGWLETFAGPFLNAIDAEQDKQAVVAEVEDALRPDCYDAESGVWSVMYVRLRVLAHKP
ncbi:hypothetical protein PANT_6c00084 [Moesziomyces antarcticus T-34]|uniref:Methyltransferase domain-containing protein n=1 Tax=Pseudozyma antarctica (strain T-34) TaxID=1151754 RepID=M9LTP5_PSEA3|nr:hypothetical protein PANT_6c00084 [Moesziomyces antarcticus T-34]